MGFANMRTIEELTDSAHDIVVAAYDEHIRDSHTLVANVVLFSGGGDSTALLDVMHATGLATHIAHVDTTIGIPETREHVDKVAAMYPLPFIVESPGEGDRFEDWIMGHGFPGPGQHFKAYQRLKERALRKIRGQLVTNGRKERVIFLAGRRRDESARRSGIPESSREGSIVWVSPLFDWTNEEIASYKAERNLPTNPVSEHLHMSGECLCGAFAKPGELEEISFFYPEVGQRIRKLELAVEASGAPPERCKWGWGANRRTKGDMSESGPLCSSCEWRQEELPLDLRLPEPDRFGEHLVELMAAAESALRDRMGCFSVTSTPENGVPNCNCVTCDRPEYCAAHGLRNTAVQIHDGGYRHTDYAVSPEPSTTDNVECQTCGGSRVWVKFSGTYPCPDCTPGNVETPEAGR